MLNHPQHCMLAEPFLRALDRMQLQKPFTRESANRLRMSWYYTQMMCTTEMWGSRESYRAMINELDKSLHDSDSIVRRQRSMIRFD